MYSLAILLLRKAKNQGLRIKQNESNDTLYFWAYLVFFQQLFHFNCNAGFFRIRNDWVRSKKKKKENNDLLTLSNKWPLYFKHLTMESLVPHIYLCF